MPNKRYWWIKLKTTFFQPDGPIDLLLGEANGAAYVIIYLMLCLQTCNKGGLLGAAVGDIIIPYDAAKIARDTRYFGVDTVSAAMQRYAQLGLIYRQEGDVLRIAGLDEMVGSESDSAARVRDHRERQKALLHNGEADAAPALQCNTETRDKITDIRYQTTDNTGATAAVPAVPAQQKIDYQAIIDLYNLLCPRLPRAATISDARRKAIRARIKAGYDLEALFKAAGESDFLAGANDRNWAADLDWILRDANAAKIMDGKYANSRPRAGQAQPAKRSSNGPACTDYSTPTTQDRVARDIAALAALDGLIRGR